MGEVGVGKTPRQDLETLRYEDIREPYLRDRESADHHIKNLDAFFKGVQVIRIDTDMLREFIDYRREEDEASDPTIRRDLIPLRAMFNLARKEGKLGSSDVPHFPMPKDSDPAGTHIEPKQFADIKEHLPDALKDFYEFMYATGCRLGALQKVTWEMLNEDCTQINLPGEIIKTRQPLLIVLAGTQLKPIADTLRTSRLNYKKEHFRNPEGIVFDSTDYRREWARAVAKAKLGTWDEKTRKRSGVRIHDCRCSAAINLLAAGVDEGLVLKIGGWKTRAMLDRYNVQHAGRLKAAMERGAQFVQAQQAAASR
jgi:integrase